MPSRVKDSKPPVTTKVRPAKVCGAVLVSTKCTVTPAAVHRSTMRLCQSIANHSEIASAIVAPTPSIAAISSTEAAANFSSDPNSVARAWAEVGPT